MFYDWHGEVKYDGCEIKMRNFVSLYEHHVQLNEEYSIEECHSTWKALYILIRSNRYDEPNILKFPWQSSFSEILRPNKKFTLDCIQLNPETDIQIVKIEATLISTKTLPEKLRFFQYGVKFDPKLNLKSVKKRDSSSLVYDCMDKTVNIILNGSNSKCVWIQISDDNTVLKRHHFTLSRHQDGAKVVTISCGKCHAVLLDNDGIVYSMGLGSKGELGHGFVQVEILEPKILDALIGLKIQQIACGSWHNVALTEFGDIYAWGWNAEGQCGIDKNLVTVILEPTLVDVVQETIGTDTNIINVACCSLSTHLITTENKIFNYGKKFLDNRHDQADIAELSKGKIDFLKGYHWTLVAKCSN